MNDDVLFKICAVYSFAQSSGIPYMQQVERDNIDCKAFNNQSFQIIETNVLFSSLDM